VTGNDRQVIASRHFHFTCRRRTLHPTPSTLACVMCQSAGFWIGFLLVARGAPRYRSNPSIWCNYGGYLERGSALR